MNDEKKQKAEISVEQSPFLKRLDNFWFHYKWVVIGVAVALMILLICVLQTCSTEKKDSVIVYAGPQYLSVGEVDQLSQVMTARLPYDYDNNGDLVAQMSMYEIYSEEQMREINQNPDSTAKIDRTRNQNQYQLFTTYQQTGESSIYFMDPWLYESMGKEYLCPLSETVGEAVEGAMADGYGVRLGDTALYRDYAVVRYLPADTVICLMKPLVWGGSSNEKKSEFEKELYRSIVTYKADALSESNK